MLRIDGADLDIDALLQEIDLVPESFYRRGDPKFSKRPGAGKNEKSGAGFLVSEAGFDDFEGQKSDAVVFLKKHNQTLSRIISWPGCRGWYSGFWHSPERCYSAV